MAQIVPAQRLIGIAGGIKITGTKNLSIFIPFLDRLKHTPPAQLLNP
jgi:hypothetical protein